MARKKESERQIISTSTKRRPYGVRLSLLLESSTKLKVDGECSLLISSDYLMRIAPKKPYANHSMSDCQCLEVSVEGFGTAEEAEQIGLKVSMGFLWSAISCQYSLRLLYHTPMPCSVYDRTKSNSGGLQVSSSGYSMIGRSIKNIIVPLNRMISSPTPADQRLLIAMELFASAKMETTARSMFVGILSSLEPLARQEKFNNKEIERLIKLYQEELSISCIEQNLKNTLRNKIDNLRIESISKAIRRLVSEKLNGDLDAISTIEEAYGIRSRILHDGSTDADLEVKGREAEMVIRRIFEEMVADYVIN